MTITQLNLSCLRRVFEEHAENGVLRRMDAPAVPHIRRCLAAGLIETTGERGAWKLTDAGQAAIERVALLGSSHFLQHRTF